MTIRKYPFSLETSLGVYVQTTSFVINGSTDKWAAIIQASRDITVEDVGFHIGTVTGTPVEHRFGIQNITANTNDPDGVYRASGTFTPTVTGFTWVTLSSSLALRKGEIVALVLEPVGTPNASNSITVTNGVNAGSFPFVVTKDAGGAWTRVSLFPVYGLRNATSGIYIGNPRTSAQTGTTVSTTGHRHALKFKLPKTFGGFFKVRGMIFRGRLQDSAPVNESVKFGVWDANGNVLLSHTSNILGTATTGDWRYIVSFDESNQPLFFNTDYYIGIERLDRNFNLDNINFTNSDDRKAFPFGTDLCLSTWNGSSWSDDTTKRPLINILLEEWNVNDPIQPDSIQSAESFGQLLASIYWFFADGIPSEESFGTPTFETTGPEVHSVIVSLECLSQKTTDANSDKGILLNYECVSEKVTSLSSNALFNVTIDGLLDTSVRGSNLVVCDSLFNCVSEFDNNCEKALIIDVVFNLVSDILFVNNKNVSINTSVDGITNLSSILSSNFVLSTVFDCISALNNSIYTNNNVLVILDNISSITSSINNLQLIRCDVDVRTELSPVLNYLFIIGIGFDNIIENSVSIQKFLTLECPLNNVTDVVGSYNLGISCQSNLILLSEQVITQVISAQASCVLDNTSNDVCVINNNLYNSSVLSCESNFSNSINIAKDIACVLSDIADLTSHTDKTIGLESNLQTLSDFVLNFNNAITLESPLSSRSETGVFIGVSTVVDSVFQNFSRIDIGIDNTFLYIIEFDMFITRQLNSYNKITNQLTN